MSRVNQLILTLWIGSLWTVCGVIVPTLFLWILPNDRTLAGNIATQVFYVETFFNLLMGAIYLALARRELSRASLIAALLTIAMPLIFFVALRPLMSSVRAAGDTARFGQLHSLSSFLFLIACVAGGVLVWRSVVNRPAK